MNLILFDNAFRSGMLPLTFTRPQAALRIGILTVKEKWELHLAAEGSYLTSPVLTPKFPMKQADDNLCISASLLPDTALVNAIVSLNKQQALVKDGMLLAVRCGKRDLEAVRDEQLALFECVEYTAELRYLDKVHCIISNNRDEIVRDFALLTKGRRSQAIDESVTLVGVKQQPELAQQIFIEEGAQVGYCYLNPTEGPIYIGKDAIIAEGAMLRGPLAIGEAAQISLGAKLLPGTTVGPWSKVGGEVSNAVISGYSNKVHDGYLGDSVLGEWCNLGAATNTSNLKNDFALVKLWDYSTGRFARTNLQMCGLVMGDYSRCAISTTFNSGTVVGVGSNIFGSGFPRNFVPSFVIGGAQGYKVNGLKTMLKTANIAMERRGSALSEADVAVLQNVFDETQVYRASLK
ncbi:MULTISPECIES: putative sugar nucleotidyl transferase [unclassified Carboxylicivirga]|uniref:putative sugar nucleotidyl transferase n=1 Tax=Carboxylicivirga TaxID=1628153 RepID=UPI003D33EF07